jgi:DNA-binding NarL/FixJ family response regulator
MEAATLDQLVAQAERRIEEIARELEPLRAEREKLLRMLEAMRTDQPSRRKRLSTKERMEQILELLEAKPGLRNREIAGTLGLTEGRISQLVDRLEAEELVLRKDGGVWPSTLTMDL